MSAHKFKPGDKVIRVIPNECGSLRYGIVGRVYTVKRVRPTAGVIYLEELEAGCTASCFELQVAYVRPRNGFSTFINSKGL